MRNTIASRRRCAVGDHMSYYIDHIIECDKLTYDRMLETWKQKEWYDRCTLRRPRTVWSTADNLTPDTKGETYLLYFVVNHSPRIWDVVDWLNEDLGIYDTHFSVWSHGECDKGWRQDGAFVPDNTMPHNVAPAEYDKEADNHKRAPKGYTTYEDCRIAVDTNVWKEVTVDYTREEFITPISPIEELLQNIDEKLERMEEMLEILTERARD